MKNVQHDCHHYSHACEEVPCPECPDEIEQMKADREADYLNRLFSNITPEQVKNCPTWQDYKNAGFPGFKRQGK